MACGLATLLGLLLCAVVADPHHAVWHGQELLGFENDDGRNAVYLHHQVHRAITTGTWDLSDPLQFFPHGVPLLQLHGGNILEFLVSGLARVALPWPHWHTAATLMWIPLNLVAFVPLGLRLWGKIPVTLAAGAAFAMAPVLIAQMAAGRLTQIALIGLPIAVLGLVDIVNNQHQRAWVTAGVGMALTGIGYWFHAQFLCVAALFFLGSAIRRRGWRPAMWDMGRAALLTLAIISPWLITLAWPRLMGAWTPAPPTSAEFMSPVFADALVLMGQQPFGLVGWLPWGLGLSAAAGLVLGDRRFLWVSGAMTCTVFALGPAQDIEGTRWLLPSYPFWKFVPGFDRMLHPDRWMEVGTLFFVLLAGEAWSRLSGLWAQLVWLLPFSVVAEQWSNDRLPLGSWEFEVPEVWRAVAERPETGAIAVVPLLQSQRTCAWQHLHGRPLLGGMVENQAGAIPLDHRDFIGQSSLLTDLWALGEETDSLGPLWQVDLDALRDAGFDTVVLDRSAWRQGPPRRGDPVRALTQALGAPIISTTDGAAWLLPQVGQAGTPTNTRSLRLEGPPGPDPKSMTLSPPTAP